MSCHYDNDPTPDEEIACLKEELVKVKEDFFTLCLCLLDEEQDNIAVRARVILNRWKPHIEREELARAFGEGQGDAPRY